jgi:hypothetical protein
MSLKLKDAIIGAYQKIHYQGVCHNNVAFRHMLLGERATIAFCICHIHMIYSGDDDTITIIDFTQSRCLDGDPDLRIETCTLVDLEEEMRKVKFLLDYPNVRDTERAIASGQSLVKAQMDLHAVGPSAQCVLNAPLEGRAIEQWEKEIQDAAPEMQYQVSIDRRSQPWTAAVAYVPLPRRMASKPLASKTTLTPLLVEPNALAAGTSQDPKAVMGTSTSEPGGSPDFIVSSSGSRQMSSSTSRGGPLSRMFSFQKPVSPGSRPSPSTEASGSKPTHSEEDEVKMLNKKVVFHPDTNDNGLWATGRDMRNIKRTRIERPPTPYYIHDSNSTTSTSVDDVNTPSLSESNVMPMPRLPFGIDPLQNTISDCHPHPISSSSSASKDGAGPRIPYSVIICGPPDVGSWTWMVTPEVFGRVVTYLDELDSAHRVPNYLSDVQVGSGSTRSTEQLLKSSAQFGPTPPVSTRRTRGLPAKVPPQTPIAPTEGQYYFPPRKPRNRPTSLPVAEVNHCNESDASTSASECLAPSQTALLTGRSLKPEVEKDFATERKTFGDKDISKRTEKRKASTEPSRHEEPAPLLRSKRIALRQTTPITEGATKKKRMRRVKA